MEKSRITSVTFVTMLLFIILAACKLAQPVLEPVIFAVFIIAIAWPLQKAMQEKVGKAIALSVTVVTTAAAILALFTLIAWGGREVVEWVRQNLDRIQETVMTSTSWLEEHDIFVITLIAEHFNTASLIRLLHIVAVRVNTILAFAVIVLVYVILGLAETEAVQARITSLENQETSRRLLEGGRKIGEKFRTYMFVRTIASIATGLAVWGFVQFMELEMAGAWGVLAFALNFLPYIGSLLITALLPLFAFVQFGSFETPLFVFLGVLVIRFIIGGYLEPVFSGSALSISPPIVLFSIVLWTFLWGALGAFLGVPLSIATLTILEQFPSTRWVAAILSGERPGAWPRQSA
ncbi:AI-2E family transporter [Methylocystis sp.]|uniref:AI-2E family transporter n=1 Tax=Methylocystis sp. TaxID=1911079 RepID=UPI0025E9C970|nr:AI-2E family transporter [Methylocystis sp.]